MVLKSLVAFSLASVLGATAMAATDYSKTPVVAHRGESYLAPENTAAAYDLAWELGVDNIEIDIRLTKDGKVVLCHDADTYRTSDKKQKLVIKDATLEEIRQVDVGSFKDPKYAGEKVPTLEEIYAKVPAGKKVFTEIKTGPEIVPAFVEVFRKSGLKEEQLVVISFQADALEASKKALPNVKHYFLAGHKKDKDTDKFLPEPNVDDWIATAKRINADGLDLHAVKPLDKAQCKKVRDAGLELHVWTIDDPAVAKRYIDWGAQSVTTNRAAWMREQLKTASTAAK